MKKRVLKKWFSNLIKIIMVLGFCWICATIEDITILGGIIDMLIAIIILVLYSILDEFGGIENEKK